MKNLIKISLSIVFLSLFVYAQDTTVVNIFSQTPIQFGGDLTNIGDSISFTQSGRIITKSLELPSFDYPVKITAHLVIKSVLQLGDKTKGDPWDRAGNVYLSFPGMENIELLKFCTGFGGISNLEQDVTDLSPLLRGNVTINGFIDTWVNPGWQIDFELIYTKNEEVEKSDWSKGIYFTTGMVKNSVTDSTPSVKVTIPENHDRIKLIYYTSGHSINGNRDEFYTKDNVIYIDDQEVHRYRPWRTDCGDFKDRNPYSGSWYDNGKRVYSYELSRSGWCPGDKIYPLVLDITDYVEPGEHEIRYAIENIYKNGDSYGYWRVSSYLAGWGEIDNWQPVSMEIAGPGDMTIMPEDVFAIRIDLHDLYGNVLPETNVKLNISCEDDSINFSSNETIWMDNLDVEILHGAIFFWVKVDASGDYQINIQESGTSNGLDKEVFSFTVSDFEIIETDFNYALTATATADVECNSSTETANHAIDGDITTKWCANNGSPDWLEVTLDEAQELNYFIIKHAGAGEAPEGDPGHSDDSSMNTKDFKIQNKVDDSWQDIVSIVGNPATNDGDVTYHYLGNTIEFKTIRLFITNPNVSRIYEFEMYNLNDNTSVEDKLVEKSDKFQLENNYPNPFNGTTKIKFFLPNYGKEEAFIFNSKGNLVSKLVSGKFNRGYHTFNWNGKGLKGESLPSGIYFVNVKFTGKDDRPVNQNIKMTYLK